VNIKGGGGFYTCEYLVDIFCSNKTVLVPHIHTTIKAGLPVRSIVRFVSATQVLFLKLAPQWVYGLQYKYDITI